MLLLFGYSNLADPVVVSYWGALHFGVRQLAAAFGVEAGSRQLAGGLNSVLRTVEY